MLFGARCPKPPLTSDPHRQRKAVKHTQYMATLFRPWTFGDADNANAGFATPEAWIAHYQSMTGVCKKWADNVATILRSNSEMRLAVSRWRFSHARKKGAKGELPPLPERPDEDLDELHEKYGSDVEDVLLLREQIAKEDPATLFLNGFLESVGSLVFPASAAAATAAAAAAAAASAFCFCFCPRPEAAAAPRRLGGEQGESGGAADSKWGGGRGRTPLRGYEPEPVPASLP
ncbi:hypothetical protein DIPPA_28521 [Diplonema papillatum]|nr:hypothetical protein DIPPA_28521 [Diplonema papillatum]